MAGISTITPVSPIKSAFELWKAAYNTARTMPGDQESGWDLVFRLADEIAAMPASDPQDVLYKIAAYTMLGESDLSDGALGNVIRREANLFVGVAA